METYDWTDEKGKLRWLPADDPAGAEMLRLAAQVWTLRAELEATVPRAEKAEAERWRREMSGEEREKMHRRLQVLEERVASLETISRDAVKNGVEGVENINLEPLRELAQQVEDWRVGGSASMPREYVVTAVGGALRDAGVIPEGASHGAD